MSTETEIPSRIKTTWLIGILAAFCIFAVIAGYSGHMTRAYTGYDQQRTHDRYITLAKLQAEEEAALNPVDKDGKPTAEWVDQGKGIIRIPIDEAMAKEVETLKTQPAQMGSAIPVIPPPASTVPAKTDAKPAAAASTNAAPANAAPAAPAPPKK